MTVGERIQMYRKQLGFSQEELGQKMLVSRQTISLWEKNQTVPTIDNLIRLKEIFNVSVDELLGFGNDDKKNDDVPLEVYEFNFTKDELNEIHSMQKKGIFKKPIISIIIWAVLLIFFIISPIHNGITGFAVGMIVLSLITYTKGRGIYNKQWKKSFAQIFETTYEYKLFEDYLCITLHRNNEKIREAKCYYTDIEKLEPKGNWFFLKISGQIYIIRKSDLKEDSAIFTFEHKTPVKKAEKKASAKLKATSILLLVFAASSLWLAMPVAMVVSNADESLYKNFWVLFLFAILPISSAVFGFVLKAKGYNKGLYLKNIIVGLIMTVLLCLFGSLSYIVPDSYGNSDTPIIKVEQATGIDIPEHRGIKTQDFSEGEEPFACYNSEIYFDESEVKEFEKQMATDGKWLPYVPNKLIGIASSYAAYENFYDYALIYNTYTSEFNKLPEKNGKYHYINVFYNMEDNYMYVVEYDMFYQK